MENLVKILKDEGVVVYGDVNLRSEQRSNFYIDIKRAYGNPEVLNELAGGIAEKIDSGVTCVAAKGLGGIPLATAVSSIRGIYLSMVRDNAKEYGLKKLIDGYVPNYNDNVIIVDDVLTSGSSINEVADTIEETGASVVKAYVVVKRKSVNLRFPVDYLVSSEDLLK